MQKPMVVVTEARRRRGRDTAIRVLCGKDDETERERTTCCSFVMLSDSGFSHTDSRFRDETARKTDMTLNFWNVPGVIPVKS